MQIIGNGFIARHAARHFGARFPETTLIAAGVSGVQVTEVDAFTREAELVYDVLRRCRAVGDTAVFLSTASAGMYGAADSPGREDGPLFPLTPYGRHKLGLEAVCAASGARCLVLRLGHIVGDGQARHQLLPSLTRQLLTGQVMIYRAASRDLLDVRHLLQTLELLLRRDVYGEIVNVASGVPIPVPRIVDELESRLGVRAERVVVDRPARAATASIDTLLALVPEFAEHDFGPSYLGRLLDRYVDDLIANADALTSTPPVCSTARRRRPSPDTTEQIP